MIGYASIDKPWLKYYSKEAFATPITDASIYEYLTENNNGNLHRIALNYMGRKISYKELFSAIEDAAKAFSFLGVGIADTVAFIAPGFPEVIYSFYAVNKLGAVSDFFDPRSDPQVIYKELQQIQPKALLIFEDFIPKYQEIIEKSNISNVIVVSAKDSLPYPIKLIAGLKAGSAMPDQWIPFKNFVKMARNKAMVETVTGISCTVAVMEHTGGTTGEPKAVCLSNQNVNSVVQQYDLGGNQHTRDESWLSVAYPFIAYALICSTHLPLVFGMTVFLCFSIEPKDNTALILKNKINHMANTPALWEYIIHNKKAQSANLSYIVNPTVGADALSIEKENEINQFLKNRECPHSICKGYGMTEVGSAVSVTNSAFYNKLGSVGIPFVHTTISVFDPDTGVELIYGQQGEVCISGPSVMVGYYRNDAENRSMLRKHTDGKLWVHTGDIGHMDSDGFLFIDGRLKRMIINHVGLKIFAPEVERVVLQCNDVDKCCVVGIPDQVHQTGEIAVAFVVTKENCHISIDSLKAICEKELPYYCVPSDFRVVEEFPYTAAAKVDYRKLEEFAGNP